MTDYEGVQQCIEKYKKSEETIKKAGLKPQAPVQEVMDTLNKVGVRITNGAKAFLHKEYIYLTIWSCLFAIVLGSTVDLLEMSMPLAPTNFPYTALSFLTGSITSIMAGYIGMRVAVYTNTRVTFQCCTSVHKGFVTAFRGGQVLGFVLVGGGVLNIMIIIFIFKAGWYNEWLKKLMTRGVPVNQCPGGANTFTNIKDDYTTFEAANKNLIGGWKEVGATAYRKYLNSFSTYTNSIKATNCPAKDFPSGTTTAALESEVTAYNKANTDCQLTLHKDWLSASWSEEYHSKHTKGQLTATYQACTETATYFTKANEFMKPFCHKATTNADVYSTQDYTPAVAKGVTSVSYSAWESQPLAAHHNSEHWTSV